MEDNKTDIVPEGTQSATEPVANKIDYKAEFDKLSAEYQKLKLALDKTNSENADYKRKERERLTDDEKRTLAEQERLEYIKKLEQSNKKFELEKTMLAKGFSQEETNVLVENASDPKAMAETMADILQARLLNNSKQVKAQILKSNTDIPDGSSNSKPLSRKDELLIKLEEANKKGDNLSYIKYMRELAELNAKK